MSTLSINLAAKQATNLTEKSKLKAKLSLCFY